MQRIIVKLTRVLTEDFKVKNFSCLTVLTCLHGSYKLEKVMNFSSRLEKSLNSVKVLEKYLMSLLGLEKSLKFSNLLMPYHFSEKLNGFAEKIGALTTNNGR